MNHIPAFDTLLKDEIKFAVLSSLAQDLGVPVAKLFSDGVGSQDIKRFVHRDVTASLIPADKTISATLITKEDCIFVGKHWVELAFALVCDSVAMEWLIADGEPAKKGDTLVKFNGNARAILIAERTALNFAQTLSATATRVHHYSKWLDGTPTKLLDTRKTLPNMRYGQKYAVQCGGGCNHRIGLYDRFLIKENHIMACGGIAQAVAQAKQQQPNLLVEVEVESLAELEQAIEANADIVMLDNFNLADISKAVKTNNGQCKLEVSGNVDENSLQQLSKTGVDFISSGAITKHVQAIDLSLRVDD